MALEQNAGVVIYQGEDKPITIRLQDQNGDPINLTDASQIKVLFLKADGTAVVKMMSAEGQTPGGQIIPLNAGGGIFQVKMPASDSIHLAIGDGQAIEVRLTVQGVLTIAQIQNAITVLPSLFPGV